MSSEQKPLGSGFGPRTTAEEIAAGRDLKSLNVVLTGGRSGIGFETARVLARAGASVISGVRDPAQARELASFKNTRVLPLDLADPASVSLFAADCLRLHPRLDLLINNAGIMATPLTRDARGYELQFSTNHLGHFQLTALLWPALLEARRPRVVTLSSAGHRFAGVDLEDPNFERRPYDKWIAYGQSKTANSLFSVELDRRGRDRGPRAFAVHPGRIVATDLGRHMGEEDWAKAGVKRENGALQAPPGGKSIAEGAATTLWCALSPQLEGQGGVYCADCDISPLIEDDSADLTGVRRRAVDPETAARLWTLSEKFCGISF